MHRYPMDLALWISRCRRRRGGGKLQIRPRLQGDASHSEDTMANEALRDDERAGSPVTSGPKSLYIALLRPLPRTDGLVEMDFAQRFVGHGMPVFAEAVCPRLACWNRTSTASP